MKGSIEKSQKIQDIYHEMEGGLTLSGVTALEDRLQDEVP